MRDTEQMLGTCLENLGHRYYQTRDSCLCVKVFFHTYDEQPNLEEPGFIPAPEFSLLDLTSVSLASLKALSLLTNQTPTSSWFVVRSSCLTSPSIRTINVDLVIGKRSVHVPFSTNTTAIFPFPTLTRLSSLPVSLVHLQLQI